MTQEHLSLAMKAVAHIIRRMQTDPRLAYLIGPGSEAFDLLTAADAAEEGLDVAIIRSCLASVKTQYLPPIGVAAAEIDEELMARIALYDDGVHDRSDRDDLNMLVNHFVGRGLDVAEAERDTQTKELF